uniref:Uncharacterized protein n=1 Tax=Arundo donax TaxID=35708 RepID=A0A0A8Z1N1_ARUDO
MMKSSWDISSRVLTWNITRLSLQFLPGSNRSQSTSCMRSCSILSSALISGKGGRPLR